jgi:hypothetical protein
MLDAGGNGVEVVACTVGNGVEVVACTVWGFGGLFDTILERGDSKLFQMLSPRSWVGHLVK